MRYHRDDATEERDTVTAWNAVRRLQPGTSERHSWDDGHPLNPQFMNTRANGMAQQGANGQQLAATLDDYIVQMPQAGAGSDDHARLGELAMARHDLETKCFEGEGCVRDFCAGQWFSLQGHAEIDSHAVGRAQFRDHLPDRTGQQQFAEGPRCAHRPPVRAKPLVGRCLAWRRRARA